jgi:hypothetical protein
MADNTDLFWNAEGDAKEFYDWMTARIAEEKANLSEAYKTLEDLEKECENRRGSWHQFHLTITALAFFELIAEFKARDALEIASKEEIRDGNAMCRKPLEVHTYHCPHCGARLGSGWGYEDFEADHKPAHVNGFKLLLKCPECDRKLRISDDAQIRPAKRYIDFDLSDLDLDIDTE